MQKKKKNTQAKHFKSSQKYEYKTEMQAINQAAIKAVCAAVKSITEVADLAEASARRYATSSEHIQGWWTTIEAGHI